MCHTIIDGIITVLTHHNIFHIITHHYIILILYCHFHWEKSIYSIAFLYSEKAEYFGYFENWTMYQENCKDLNIGTKIYLLLKSKIWSKRRANYRTFKWSHSRLITEYIVPYSKAMTDAEIPLVIKSTTSASACSQDCFGCNYNAKNIIHFIEFWIFKDFTIFSGSQGNRAPLAALREAVIELGTLRLKKMNNQLFQRQNIQNRSKSHIQRLSPSFNLIIQLILQWLLHKNQIYLTHIYCSYQSNIITYYVKTYVLGKNIQESSKCLSGSHNKVVVPQSCQFSKRLSKEPPSIRVFFRAWNVISRLSNKSKCKKVKSEVVRKVRAFFQNASSSGWTCTLC